MPSLTEEQIRQITEQAVRQLGGHATLANIEKVVHEAVHRLSEEKTPQKQAIHHNHKESDRVIVTAFGQNKMGILAGLTGCLAQSGCDIMDLSQKILQEFFTIMLLVDISYSEMSFEEIKNELIRVGEQFDLKVIVQHEQIFKTMHRV